MISKEEQQILKFFQSYNIDRIVNYHNEIKRLFHNEICNINVKVDDETVDQSIKNILLVRKNSYINDFYPQMIITNFLMMFSYLEEYLFQIKSRLNNNVNLLEREGSIGRFKNVINSVNNNLVNTKIWQFFTDAEQIRNCLLHANGRIDLIKSKKRKLRLKSIIDSSKGLLNIKNKRISLSPKFLSKFIENIDDFHVKTA